MPLKNPINASTKLVWDKRSHTKTPVREEKDADKEPDDTTSDEDEGETPSTNYNNPAKSVTKTGPYAIKPHCRNIEKYSKYFPGTNINTIRKTLDAITQLGTRGAVDGHNL